MWDEIDIALARRVDERMREQSLRTVRLRLVLGCALAVFGSLVVVVASV